MHVGNCTDGSADYNLAGGGQIVEPPEFTGNETFRLDKDKQNLWTITGTKTVTFLVNGAEVARVQNVSDSDLAILVQCGTTYAGFKLAQAAHQEVP